MNLASNKVNSTALFSTMSFRFFTKTWISGAFLLLAIIFFAFSMIDRWVFVDDACFAEWALCYSKNGHLCSNTWGDFLYFKEQMFFVGHKLHIINTAFWIYIWGFNPFAVKFVAFPFLWILLGSMGLYLYKRSQFHIGEILFVLALLLINCHVFFYSFVCRPEMAVTSLGFLSFLALTSKNQNHKYLCIAISGICAGLAVLYHLNGLIFILAGGVFLFLEKRWTSMLLFGIFSGLTSGLYFYDVDSMQDLQKMLFQFRNDPALKKDHYQWYNYLFKPLEEHKRFFHDVDSSVISLCFFSALVFHWKYNKIHLRRELIYFGLVVFWCSILTRGVGNSHYFTYYIPWMMIVFTHALFKTADNEKNNWQNKVILGLCGLYIATSFIIDGKWAFVEKTTNLASNFRSLMSPIPKGSSILTNTNMIFNEVENYDFQVLETYTYAIGKDLYPENKGIFNFALAQNREYVILNAHEIKDFQIDTSLAPKYNYLGFNSGDKYYYFWKKNK